LDAYYQLHQNATTVISWNGELSQPFPVEQGVRQGGAISTDVYNIYIDPFLVTIEDNHLAHIGDT